MADSDYMYVIVHGEAPGDGAVDWFETVDEAESFVRRNSPGDVKEDGTLKNLTGVGSHTYDEPYLAIVKVARVVWDDYMEVGFPPYTTDYKED